MNNHTLQERLSLVKFYYAGNSISQTRYLFSVQFEDRPIPTRSSISMIINNLKKLEILCLQKHAEETVMSKKENY